MRSTAPVHGSVSSTTPTAASPGHSTRLPPLPVGHGDPERAEEFQRAGRAQRDPGQRRHEEHRHPAVTTPSATQVQEGADPGEGRRARPHDHEHQNAGPRQAQPRRTLGADAIDQTDRNREPDLHAQHGGHGHQRAGALRMSGLGHKLFPLGTTILARTIRRNGR